MIESGKQLLHKGHVNKIYEWCKKKYGRSKYNGRYPDIVFKKPDYYTGEDWGYYDEDEALIYINKDKHTNMEDLIHTIIHEYVHYKQNMYHYRIISEYMDPLEHPMEKEADEVAERDLKECMDYMKSIYGEKIIGESASLQPLKQHDNIYCQVCTFTIPSIG